MSVPSAKLYYDYKRKLNAVNSGKAKNIPLVDSMAYLNEGQEIWFENRVQVAERDQKVRNDLRVYEIKNKSLDCLAGKGFCFASYPSNFYKRLNQIALCTKPDCCPDIEKQIIIRIVQSDDLYEARQNPYRKANFYFEQLLGDEGGDGLYIYHEDQMNVGSVFIDYFRKPNQLHAPSLEKCNEGKYYDYFGREVTKDTNFESDTYSANDVVDIAVLLTSRDIRDIPGFQTQLNTILQTEKLYK